MEERPPLKTLLFVTLVILLPFFSINVESQQQQQQQQQQPPPQNGQQGNAPLSPSPPLLSPPPPLFPPPSPMLRPPPPPLFSPPPPSPLRPPLPFVPPSPRVLSPPPPRNPPPPPYNLHSPPKSPHELNTNSQLNHHKAHKKKNGSNLNQGQKIGLLFVGIVVILQIGVVGFLAFKRRQLLMTRD